MEHLRLGIDQEEFSLCWLTHTTVKSIAKFQNLYITSCSAHTAAPQKRSMFIHKQPTPNPESLMFHPNASLEFLKEKIFAAIMDIYSSGEPLFLYSQAAASKNTVIHDDDSETVAMIKELLETRIRPAVQDDGGTLYIVVLTQIPG